LTLTEALGFRQGIKVPQLSNKV